MPFPFQLVLLPGLGADYRLLDGQREAFPQLVVPPWIPPRQNESLPDYAGRMAGTVASLPGVPLVLGGVSFGGMLAYEMARHLKPDAVVLIASCRTPPRSSSGVSRRALAAAVDSGPGMDACQAARTAGGANAAGRSVRQKDMAVRMFKESDNRFMHWTVNAILNWAPEPLAGIRVCACPRRPRPADSRPPSRTPT